MTDSCSDRILSLNANVMIVISSRIPPCHSFYRAQSFTYYIVSINCFITFTVTKISINRLVVFKLKERCLVPMTLKEEKWFVISNPPYISAPLIILSSFSNWYRTMAVFPYLSLPHEPELQNISTSATLDMLVPCVILSVIELVLLEEILCTCWVAGREHAFVTEKKSGALLWGCQ